MPAGQSWFDESQGTMTVAGDFTIFLGSQLFWQKGKKERECAPRARMLPAAARVARALSVACPADGRGYQLLHGEFATSAPGVTLTLLESDGRDRKEKRNV